MVVGEPPPDGFRDQRVHAGIARAQENDRRRRAEPGLGGKQNQAPEQRRKHAAQQQPGMADARHHGDGGPSSSHEGDPVKGQNPQRALGAHAHTANQQ